MFLNLGILYQMVHAGDALGLHEVLVQQEKELFAAFHDNRELVQQFKGMISACLSESFDQVSRDTRQFLEMMTGEGSSSNDSNNEDEGQKVVNGRASRRNDLHSASLASNGGLHLDATIVPHGGVSG